MSTVGGSCVNGKRIEFKVQSSPTMDRSGGNPGINRLRVLDASKARGEMGARVFAG